MRSKFTFILVFTINMSLFAQTEITSASFPEAGDVLKTLTLDDPNIPADFRAELDANWDFSDLTANGAFEEIYLDIAEAQFDSLFPEATTFQGGDGFGETYFRGTDTEFAFLGFAGTDLTGLGFGSDLVYSSPYVIRRAMSFVLGDQFFTSTQAISRIGVTDLPDFLQDSLLANIPIPIDSIGVGVTLERSDFTDAWGKVSIPGGTFDVIRMKSTETTNTVIEVKVPIFGWQDISGFLGGGGGPGFGGIDTTVTYQYISNDAKEPILVLTLNNDETEVEEAQFKDLGVVTVGTHFIEETPFEFTISPNPTDGPVVVEISDLPFGEYQLVLFDLNGKIIQKDAILGENNYRNNYQFDHLTAGTYFFTLKNINCLLYTSPSPRDATLSRMPSSA